MTTHPWYEGANQVSKWTMPEWMEPYRSLLADKRTEELYNGTTAVQINAPLALMEQGVQAQIQLLYSLHKRGIL